MKQRSLSQKAYDDIKHKIVSLELRPGSVIDEAGLQQELGLGRTPIREALKRLSLEKLVTIVPRRGMFVTDIGLTDLQQLFEVRLVLEGLAARFAASRGSETLWSRMEEALYSLPGAEEEADNQALIAIDEACHHIIYEAAGNEFLKDTLITLYALSLRLWYLALSRIGNMRGVILDHRQIMDALRAGQVERAGQLMEEHIQAFQEDIQSVMLGLPVPNGQV